MIAKKREDVAMGNDIIFLDENDKPIIFLDGIMGRKTIYEGGLTKVTLDETLHLFMYGSNDKVEEGVEKRSFDFSDISDEDWLKLKSCKKIVFNTIEREV